MNINQQGSVSKTEDRCFDIDKPDRWNHALRELVYSDSAWESISASIEKHGDEFFWEFDKELENVNMPIVRCLATEVMKALRSEYDCVVAYHGCRPISWDTYRRDGIRICEPERLFEEARDIFHELPDVSKRLPACFSEPDMNQRTGRVGLIFSRETALENNFAFYKEGSEFLHIIANRLGPPAPAIWLKRGIPTLIRCKLPIEFLETHEKEHAFECYARAAVKTLIFQRTDPSEPYYEHGGFHVTHTILPAFIDEFIDMSGHLNEVNP